MKIKTFSVVTMLAIVAGCTATTPTMQTGEDAETTHDGLVRVDRTIMDAVWVRPDIDVTGVDKIMLIGIGVEYRNVSGPYSGRAGSATTRATASTTEFQLDEDTKALFEEQISGAFQEELGTSDAFELVDEPGPDVLAVFVGLHDVVSRVPPERTGRSRVFIDSVGDATLVLEIRDSESNTVLVRAVDRRAAQSGMTMIESSRARNLAEVRRLGRRWARILREGLETALGGGLQ